MSTTLGEVLTVNGRQVTVRHTDDGAARLCERSAAGFARTVAGEYLSWKTVNETLAHTFTAPPPPFRRRAWLHLLAQEQEYREQNPGNYGGREVVNPNPPMTLVGPMHGIYHFLRRPMAVQRSNRKHWGVTFESGRFYVEFSTGTEDQCVRIWGRSPKPEGGLYGRPVARIDAVGDLYVTADCGGEFSALIDEFESNPEAFVAAYGKKTGRCCFCRLRLTDPRSEEVGYGKICARHYRLPWGGKTPN